MSSKTEIIPCIYTFTDDDILIIQESLRIALSTIFYHRLIGAKNILEVDSQLLPSFSYLQINNHDLITSIDNIVNVMGKKLEKQEKAKVLLSFYETKTYFLGYLGGGTPSNLWETWELRFVHLKSSKTNYVNQMKQEIKNTQGNKGESKKKAEDFEVINNINEVNIVRHSDVEIFINSDYYGMNNENDLDKENKDNNESEVEFKSETTLDKEKRIRKFIFEIIQKLNENVDKMPNINITDIDKVILLPEETFPYNVSSWKYLILLYFLCLANNKLRRNIRLL